MSQQQATYACLLCDQADRYRCETKAAFTTHVVRDHRVPFDELKRARAINPVFLDGQGWSSQSKTFVLPDGRPVLALSVEIDRRRRASR